jgi:hypothetical protein
MLWILIIAYLILTGLAVYFSQDEGVFDGFGFAQTCIRITSLMLIGWLVALLIAIGVSIGAAGVFLAENFLKYKSNPEGDFSLLHWFGKELKILAKLIIPRRKKKEKKEEAEACPKDSQEEQTTS